MSGLGVGDKKIDKGCRLLVDDLPSAVMLWSWVA